VKRLYAELPGEGLGVARPVLDVVVEGLVEAPLRCLVDPGSIHTLMPTWVASEAGVELKEDEGRRLRLGGGEVMARFARAHLSVAGQQWEAPIGFCDPWPYGWGLLGQQFFRFFVVTFRAADWELEIEPVSA
jgi:hypothetical protein